MIYSLDISTSGEARSRRAHKCTIVMSVLAMRSKLKLGDCETEVSRSLDGCVEQTFFTSEWCDCAQRTECRSSFQRIRSLLVFFRYETKRGVGSINALSFSSVRVFVVKLREVVTCITHLVQAIACETPQSKRQTPNAREMRLHSLEK